MVAILAIAGLNMAFAQAQIKFDKLSCDLGSFPESSPVQKCTFTFTNVGDQPLIINQAVASCGCTVPSYTKTPIKPGEKGTISVTYNGKGKFPGHFKKTIEIPCPVCTGRRHGIPDFTPPHSLNHKQQRPDLGGPTT